MLELNIKLPPDAQEMPAINGVLMLPFDIRQKSRFRASLTDGTDVGVMVERGSVLRDGDCLSGPDGRTVRVQAAAETVSTVSHPDPAGSAPTVLTQAAYHLGNRHVALQIGNGWLRYLHDHVLDDMCRQLGLRVKTEQAPFEPESGAYRAHSHSHEHG